MKLFPYKIKGHVPAIIVRAASQTVCQKFVFLVDTGASNCCISRKAAGVLGFDIDAVTDIGPGLFTASDVVYPKLITLASFEAFGLCEENFRIRVVNFPDDTDGVVGFDFICRFRSFKFNIPDIDQEATIQVGRDRHSKFSVSDLADLVAKVVLIRRRK